MWWRVRVSLPLDLVVARDVSRSRDDLPDECHGVGDGGGVVWVVQHYERGGNQAECGDHGGALGDPAPGRRPLWRQVKDGVEASAASGSAGADAVIGG